MDRSLFISRRTRPARQRKLIGCPRQTTPSTWLCVCTGQRKRRLRSCRPAKERGSHRLSWRRDRMNPTNARPRASAELLPINPPPSALLGGREFPHDLIKIKTPRLLADGELFEALKPVRNHGLGAEVDVSPVYHPVVVQE